MKYYRLLFLLPLFAACSSPSTEQNSTDSIIERDSFAVSDTSSYQQCFLHLAGTSGQDTTSITFRVKGNEVEGSLNWIPFEKDARRGTVKGTINADLIKGTWTFMQEGMTDSLPVEFKVSGDKLLQKPYSYNQATGKQYLAGTSTYDLEFERISCP